MFLTILERIAVFILGDIGKAIFNHFKKDPVVVQKEKDDEAAIQNINDIGSGGKPDGLPKDSQPDWINKAQNSGK